MEIYLFRVLGKLRSSGRNSGVQREAPEFFPTAGWKEISKGQQDAIENRDIPLQSIRKGPEFKENLRSSREISRVLADSWAERN
jgi:hypothetical protein